MVALYGGVADAKTAADVTTDIQITEPNLYLARQMAAAGQPVFVYHFSYAPASERSTALGASHGAEVAYVFATLPMRPLDYGGRTYPAATPEDRKVSDAMLAYWVAFAKTGEPDSAGGPAWPRYSASNDQILEFGVDGVNVRQDFEKDRLDMLEQATGR